MRNKRDEYDLTDDEKAFLKSSSSPADASVPWSRRRHYRRTRAELIESITPKETA